MSSANPGGPVVVALNRRDDALRLHDIPFELVPCEVPFFLVHTQAGFPSPAQDDMQEPIDLGAWLVDHPAASYIMRVDGRSMSGAGINDGDLIVVNRAKKPKAGAIVVALVHGDRTLKRLRYVDGRHWLVPEAEGFPDILVDEHVEIWATVVGFRREGFRQPGLPPHPRSAITLPEVRRRSR